MSCAGILKIDPYILIQLINKSIFMKSLFLALTVALTFTMVGAQNVSSYILELETNTKWDAVEETWKSQRTNWVSNVKSNNKPKVNADLLLLFESNLKWSSVEEGWKPKRDKWVKNCEKATSHSQVAVLLVELESNMKWTSVDEKWKKRREAWIKELMEF